MCIRYDKSESTILPWAARLQAKVDKLTWPAEADTFPGYTAPILFEGPRRLELATWGIVPAWAKDTAWGKKNAYNARSETLLQKPTFRTAYEKRRCIVPVSAYYERDNGRWYRVTLMSGEIFTIAGLYEPPNEFAPLQTFTMVTTESNDVTRLYNDRMPVLLDEDECEAWLDPDATHGFMQWLFVPKPSDWLKIEDAGPVGKGIVEPVQVSLFEDQ